MQIPREKEANQSSLSPLPGVALAGPGSPKPLSRLVRTATRVGQLGPRWSARAPRGRASRWSRPPSLPPLGPRPPTYRRVGAGVGRFRPRPAAPPRRAPSGPGRQPSAQPLLPRGASPARVPSLRAQACSPRPGRAEGGGGGEGGEKGGRKARERELLGSRTSQSLPGARTQRLSGPSVPAAARAPHLLFLLLLSGHPSPPPSSSSYARAAAAPAPTRPHPQLSGLRPGTRALAPSFLASFLPSRPPSRSRSPSRVPIVSVPVSVRRARLALPRLSPSHFLSRQPPPSRRGSPRPSRRCPGSSPRSPRRPPEGPGARGGNSGRARLAQPRAPALPGEEGPGR